MQRSLAMHSLRSAKAHPVPRHGTLKRLPRSRGLGARPQLLLLRRLCATMVPLPPRVRHRTPRLLTDGAGCGNCLRRDVPLRRFCVMSRRISSVK